MTVCFVMVIDALFVYRQRRVRYTLVNFFMDTSLTVQWGIPSFFHPLFVVFFFCNFYLVLINSPSKLNLMRNLMMIFAMILKNGSYKIIDYSSW